MDSPNLICIQFKQAQMKSFSSMNTLTTYTNVAKRYVSVGELAGTNHWMEYVPIIHSCELSILE